MKQLIFILTFLSLSTGFSQEIKFNISAPDTTIYMARYFGKQLYYADTAELVQGSVVFDGSKHRAGLYALLMPNGKPFDFIIDGEPAVEMTVKDMDNANQTMQVIKSTNNKLFFDYMKFTAEKRIKAKELGEKMQSIESEKEKEKLKSAYQKINEEVKAYQNNLVDKHAEKFVAVMIKMSMDVEQGEVPEDEQDNPNYAYEYYLNHFWDNVDLSDYRVVNTPVFHNRLDKYFVKRGYFVVPDSICVYAKKMIDQTDQVDQSNKVFQYLVHYITNKYETMQIVGMDKVFYFMAQNYYCPPNNKAYWVPEENLQKICERRDKIGRTLIGNPAIPLILTDSTENNWINFYDLNGEYTVLYFWDPHCGHCKKTTPKLQTLYEEKFKERNVQIYAVGKASGDDFADWKKFIRDNNLEFTNVGVTDSIYNIVTDSTFEARIKAQNLLQNHTTVASLKYAETYDVFSTPKIFILDKDGIILYKQISIGQLEEIIDKLTGHEEDEKLFPVSDPENAAQPLDE